MDLILLIAVIALVAIIVIVGYYLLKLTLKLAVWLILNALGGLFILFISNYMFNMNIPYDLPTLLVSAIGGVPGAVCIDILKIIGTTL